MTARDFEAEAREWLSGRHHSVIFETLGAKLAEDDDRARKEESSRIVGLMEAARARISELEDTILMNKAADDVARSFGRNTEAVRIEQDIMKRRGVDWRGAVVVPRMRCRCPCHHPFPTYNHPSGECENCPETPPRGLVTTSSCDTTLPTRAALLPVVSTKKEAWANTATMKPTPEEVCQWLRDQTEYDCGNEPQIRDVILAALAVAEACRSHDRGAMEEATERYAGTVDEDR